MRGKDTKERIVEEAFALFASRGFHAVSVRDIAAAVGIKDASLYNHFSGKQAIFDAIVRDALERTRRFFGERSSPVRRLRRRDAVRGDERRAHTRDGAAVVSLLLRGSVHGAPAPFAGDQPVRERGGGARLPPRVRRAAHGAAAHHLRASHGDGRVRPRRRRADGRRTAGRPVHAHACGSDMGGSRTAARAHVERFARAHTAAGRGIRGGERA